PSSAVIERASDLLRNARRPMIVAGGGARGASTQLRKLAESLDAYVVTTVAGKGVLPERHPANLGASLQFGVTQELVARA
ncbi:acetolactate synthase, partial [Streptomyces scabiei]